MKQPIIKIEFKYDVNGNKAAIAITRGSFYLHHITRIYIFNGMSDAQHNLNIILSDRNKWTSFFYKMSITAFPAWFILSDSEGITRAAGSLGHCKHFHKPNYKITRRTNYPTLKG